MKLYNSIGPNPRLVRMFIAEKGLDIPRTEVDLIGGENRRPEYKPNSIRCASTGRARATQFARCR